MSDVSEEEVFDGVGKFIKIAPFNPKDIDLAKPPTNGEEYLQRVIIEKRTVKSKSVKLDRSSMSNHNDVAMEVSNDDVRDIDTTKLPTRDWCTEQIQVFSDLRAKAGNTKLEIAQGKLTVQFMDNKLFYDEDYCYQFISAHQPTQSILTKLNQVALDSFLEHLSDYLVSERVAISVLGRWIYAVMVYLEIPLVPEMHHSLRTIAKHCRTTREKTAVTDVETLAALNLFILIISNYFGQTDLGDSIV